MTRILVVLGIVLVIMGGSIQAISDADKADSSPNSASDGAGDAEQPAEAAEDPTPEVPPEPEPVTNRQDCNAIRGQEYLSPEERVWFLTNCVTQ